MIYQAAGSHFSGFHELLHQNSTSPLPSRSITSKPKQCFHKRHTFIPWSQRHKRLAKGFPCLHPTEWQDSLRQARGSKSWRPTTRCLCVPVARNSKLRTTWTDMKFTKIGSVATTKNLNASSPIAKRSHLKPPMPNDTGGRSTCRHGWAITFAPNVVLATRNQRT
jgi:hypothetical protein